MSDSVGGTSCRRPLLESLEPRLLLDAAGEGQALELFSTAPAVFAENRGQWADAAIRYAFDGAGANVGFTADGPVFQIFRREPVEDDGSDANDTSASADEPGPALPSPLPPDPLAEDQEYVTRGTSFSVHFDGASPTEPVGLNPAETRFNYFVGDQANWRSDVPTYETVAYPGLYDGIDLYTWGQRDSLKYEFHVAPGADFRDIRVSYDGIEGLSLDSDGALYVKTELGELVDAAPVIYQEIGGERIEVAGAFSLVDADTYTFEVAGPYDPARELVIDPDLAWSTYLGGSDSSSGLQGGGTAVDLWGNVLVTGRTDLPGWTSGGFDTSYNGGFFGCDAFVAKLSTSGDHVWSTYIGGGGSVGCDQGYDIAVDGSGYAFVTGETWGYVESASWVSGGFDTSYNGSSDGFVAKLSPSGGHVWSTYLGGQGADSGRGIAVDSSGNVLVAGYTDSLGWASGGFDTDYNGGQCDAFMARVGSSGDLMWSTYLGGGGEDWGYGIAIASSGDAVMVGYTDSSAWAQGGFDPIHNGYDDAFVAKLSPAGAHVWSTYLGGEYWDQGYAVSTDRSGNVYVAGETTSSGWIAGGFDTNRNGYRDAFVAKLSPFGDHIWSTYLGGEEAECGYGIVADAAGGVLVTGETGSSDWVSGGFDLSYNGSYEDAFVVRLSSSGSHLWSSYLGGGEPDCGYGIAVDDAGAAVVTGETGSSGWVSGGFDTSYSGSLCDAFVAKIRFAPQTTWVSGVPVGNYTPAGRTADDIRWIVLHTTEATASSATNWFKNPSSGVSTHYLVRRDGSILQFVGDDDIAHHAGNWRYNQHSIGIEHERYTGAELTDVQLAASAQLVQWLADQYDIPVVFAQGVAPPDPVSGEGFIGHDQVPDPSYPSQGGGANRHSDPVNWDWGYYRSLFDSSLPAAPSDLTAVALTNEEIRLEWEDRSEGEQGFRIERKDGLEGNWTEVDTQFTDSITFHDTGLASDTTYYYRTCAYNAQGLSGYTNVAQATPREALAPRIEYVEPAAPTVSDEPQPFTVHGSNFAAGAAMTLTCLSTGEVFSNVPITSQSNNHLSTDIAFGDSPGRWNVEVTNPGEVESAEHHFNVSRVVEELLGWGFDYPIGNRGYDDANCPVPLEEFPAPGDNTLEVNDLYPDGPVADPSRGSSGGVAAGTWYNVQDVGAFFEACGGIHSGEDWNRAPAPNGDVGQTVYAVGSGAVIRARDGGSNGWTLVVRHEIPGTEPVYSIYEHVEPLPTVGPVANGIAVEVTRGEPIATVAPITAYSPHLHFEMRTRYTVDGDGGNIRDVPGGTDIGDVPVDPEQTGDLLDGPVRAEYMGNEYTWWKVDWGDGLVGWSVEAALNFNLYDTANSSYYYSNSERESLPSMDAGQVAEAFRIMQEEGIEDPSDYIDANRYTLAHHLRNGLFAFASMGAWGTGGSGLVDVVETTLGGLRRHWVGLTAQSPVTLSQTVSTPESEFEISFDYQFQTTTGTLEVLLDSTVVDAIEAPASLSDEVSSHTSTVWSPTLAGRENAALQFRLDGPEGSQILLTNVRLEPTPESDLVATWTGGADDRWENAANWSRPTPPGSWAEGSFNQPTAHNPVLSQDQSVGRVNFQSAGWTLGGTGHTLTLGEGGIDSAGAGTNAVEPDIVLAEDSTWNVSAGNTLVLNGTLSGGGHTLTKEGDGTLVLEGGQDHGTGLSLTINGGTVRQGGGTLVLNGLFFGTDGGAADASTSTTDQAAAAAGGSDDGAMGASDEDDTLVGTVFSPEVALLMETSETASVLGERTVDAREVGPTVPSATPAPAVSGMPAPSSPPQVSQPYAAQYPLADPVVTEAAPVPTAPEGSGSELADGLLESLEPVDLLVPLGA